ncbi:MAG: hypothetical protein ACAH07_08860 [Methylophilaceae bacterium]
MDAMNPSVAITPSDSSATPARNPGPSWGYRFLRACDRYLPEILFRPARALGTWVALAFMGRLDAPLGRGLLLGLEFKYTATVFGEAEVGIYGFSAFFKCILG